MSLSLAPVLRGEGLAIPHKLVGFFDFGAEDLPAEGEVVGAGEAEPDGLGAGVVGVLFVDVAAELSDEADHLFKFRWFLGGDSPRTTRYTDFHSAGSKTTSQLTSGQLRKR